ncbi:MAG: hypothetical protein OXG79_04685 [Chloroflexi bacterium]|nr:hypothetical protein [Chloroflexota bacterium]
MTERETFPHLGHLIASICTLLVLVLVWLCHWLLWTLAVPAPQREPTPIWVWGLLGAPIVLSLLMLAMS